MATNLLDKLRQSIFPDFPRGSNISHQDGSMTEVWHLALSNLFQNLQRTFSNEGFQFPGLNETDLDSIEQIYTNLIGKTLSSTNPSTPNIAGKIVYDITNEVPKVFVIKFSTPSDPSSNILVGTGWKTIDLEFTAPYYTAAELANILAVYTALPVAPLPSNIPNITGKIVYDIDNEVPKIFILTFATPGDFTSNLTGAFLKTFTIT